MSLTRKSAVEAQGAGQSSRRSGFGGVARLALRDVLRSLRKDGLKGVLVWLFLLCFAILPLAHLDSEFLRLAGEITFGEGSEKWLQECALWIGRNGDMQLTVLPSALALVGVGIWRRNSFLKRAAVSLVICSLMAGVSVHVAKKCLGRPRPLVVQKGMAKDPVDLIGPTISAKWNSFPSGHSSSAACGLVFLVLIFPRVGPLVIVTVTVIGLSRVVCSAHWLTDVIGGVSHGCVWGWIGGKHLRQVRLRAAKMGQRVQKASSTHELSAADQP